jgi:diguanylate cyclase (GGDEF)-like protein
MICSVRDISERHQASQILEYMATHDPLTGLPNRALFQDRLEQAIKRATRKNTHIAVLLIDLDHFKRINDTLGHLKGDQVLKDASRRLLACLRESDTVARMGGDEFTVILEDISDPKEIKNVAQKLMDAVSLPYEMEEGLWKLTASIGISIFPTDGTDMETLLRCADIAMYRAKRRRNRYTFY